MILHDESARDPAPIDAAPTDRPGPARPPAYGPGDDALLSGPGANLDAGAGRVALAFNPPAEPDGEDRAWFARYLASRRGPGLSPLARPSEMMGGVGAAWLGDLDGDGVEFEAARLDAEPGAVSAEEGGARC